MKNMKKKVLFLMTCLITAAIFSHKEPLQAQAAGRPVSIESCLISGDQVVCELDAAYTPSSDDGMYYIYANVVFQDGITGDVVASETIEKEVTMKTDYIMNHLTMNNQMMISLIKMMNNYL